MGPGRLVTATRLRYRRDCRYEDWAAPPGGDGCGGRCGLAVSGQGSLLRASSGRSAVTAERAEEAGLEDVGTVEELSGRSDVILSLCPPHVAVDIARSVPRFAGIYVDANAISPATARTIAALVGRYVDGGIIGSPPRNPGTTRLYLSGTEATTIADLFAGTVVEAPWSPMTPVRRQRSRWPTRPGRRARLPSCLRFAASRAQRGRRDAHRRMANVSTAPARAVRRGRPLGAHQGVALGRRDERDLRDVRCGRSARRLPPRGCRDLPAIAARTGKRERRPRARPVVITREEHLTARKRTSSDASFRSPQALNRQSLMVVASHLWGSAGWTSSKRHEKMGDQPVLTNLDPPVLVPGRTETRRLPRGRGRSNGRAVACVRDPQPPRSQRRL